MNGCIWHAFSYTEWMAVEQRHKKRVKTREGDDNRTQTIPASQIFANCSSHNAAIWKPFNPPFFPSLCMTSGHLRLQCFKKNVGVMLDNSDPKCFKTV